MTAADLSTILSFRESMRQCVKCPISANTGGPIPFNGPLNPQYAILGEAPGRTEANGGEPFIGDSGAILRHWLKQAGVDPSTVTFLNSVACWPSRNPATPTHSEIANCRPWVHGQLEIIRPQVLLTMGVIAFNQIHHPHTWPKLQNLHGKPTFYPRLGTTIFSTYHPAAYLRGRSKKYEKLIVEDIAAMAIWDGGALETCYVCDDELYRFCERGIGLCYRHAQRQGILFPEDVSA